MFSQKIYYSGNSESNSKATFNFYLDLSYNLAHVMTIDLTQVNFYYLSLIVYSSNRNS